MTSADKGMDMEYLSGKERRSPGKEEQNLSPKKKQLSLAERIQEFRKRKHDNDETNPGMADSLPQDLYSLIGLYREILGVETRLSADVVRSISSIRTSELQTRSHDSRQQRSDADHTTPHTQGSDTTKSPEIAIEASEMTQVLLTPREPEVFKNHQDPQLTALSGLKRDSMRGKVLPRIESSSQDQYSKRLSPRGFRRSRFSRRKLILDATKSRGNSSGFLLTHIVDSSDSGYEAVLDAFQSKPDTASSCTQTVAENIPTVDTESSGTLLEEALMTHNANQRHTSAKLPQRSGFNIVKNLVSTKKKLSKKKNTKYRGYSKRSLKSTPTSRCFHFVGQSLKRSFSLPSLNDGLFHGGTDMVKSKRYYDIEQINNPDIPFTKETKVDRIESQKRAGSCKKQGVRPKQQRKHLPQNRVILPGFASPYLTDDKKGITLPSINGHKNGPSSASSRVSRSHFTRRPYLRSISCGELTDEQDPQALVPRFLALYKDLKALDTLSTEDDTNIRMKVKATTNQNTDIIVTWGAKPEKVEPKLFTKPSYMFDVASVYRSVNGRKKKPEKKKKKTEERMFLYPSEMPVFGLRNDVQSVSSFLGKVPKALDIHQGQEKKSVYHRNCVAVGDHIPWRFT